jgi:CheY-like chemotaxis protein
MVIDDDEVSLAVVSLMLSADGHEVIQAGSGEQALEVAAGLSGDRVPMLVLADLQMPGLCGSELALALRASLPGTRIVAMSATPQAVDGYDGFLAKPLNFSGLRAVLSEPDEPVAGQGSDGPLENQDDTALDEAVYFKLRHMMPEASLAEVYETCLRDTRQRVAEIPALAERDHDDLVTVRRAAHTIKGGAGMVGARRLAEAAALVESGRYRSDDLPELCNKILDSCNQLERILKVKLSRS